MESKEDNQEENVQKSIEKKKQSLSLDEKINNQNKEYANKICEKIKSSNGGNNIAIIGDNGEGKSSIIQSFLESCKLDNNNSEDIKEKTITINLSKYKNYEDDSSQHYGNKIEFQIINQILYQINFKNAYLSKYGIKKNKSNKLKIFWSIFTSFFIVSFYFLICCSTIDIKFDNWNSQLSLLFGLSAFLILLIIPLNILLIWKEKWKKISKIIFKFLGSQFELNNSLNNSFNLSILDREWREIVYLLIYSEKEYVIFENLDKLNNYELLTKLKELNLIINKQQYKKNKVTFIYVLSANNFFEGEGKSHFFDDIIYTISASSIEIKVEMFFDYLDNSEFLDRAWIYKICKFIDNIRQVKFISEQYNQHLKINFNAQVPKWFDYNKLLSMILIKNYFYDFYKNLKVYLETEYYSNIGLDHLLFKYKDSHFFNLLVERIRNKKGIGIDIYDDVYNYIFLNSSIFLDNDIESEFKKLEDWSKKEINLPNIFLSKLLKNNELLENNFIDSEVKDKDFYLFLNFNLIKILLEIEENDTKSKLILKQIFIRFNKIEYVEIWKNIVSEIEKEPIFIKKKKKDKDFKSILNMIEKQKSTNDESTSNELNKKQNNGD